MHGKLLKLQLFSPGVDISISKQTIETEIISEKYLPRQKNNQRNSLFIRTRSYRKFAGSRIMIMSTYGTAKVGTDTMQLSAQ